MNDTTADMQAELRKRLKATDASERLRMMAGMFSAAKSLARASHGRIEGENDLGEAYLLERFYRTDFSTSEMAAISEHLKTAHAK